MPEYQGRVFDRIPEYDEHNLEYAIRPMLLRAAPEPITTFWDIQTWLDQLDEGACVGFAWAHDINAEPDPNDFDEGYARFIYNEAKFVDEWTGEDYEGTSVLAGAKIVTRLGHMTEYRWAFNVDDILGALTTIGPVVLGLWWYEGMLETDPDGYLRPWGKIVGGHAILAVGVDYEQRAIRVHNSWGRSWGEDGRAWISFIDLDLLFQDEGEGCIPLIRVPVPIEPEPEPEPQPEPEPEPGPQPAPVPNPTTPWYKKLWNWIVDLIVGKDE